MTPTGTVEYGYDTDGIRTSKIQGGTTTSYVVDHNRPYAQVLAELQNPVGAASSRELVKTYTYGDDLVSQQAAGNDSFYLYDGLGSTGALADGAGAVTDSYDYGAFGKLLDSTGSTDNSYRFTGEQFDSGLGQYYLRARYYDPAVGRFTQMDTWQGRMQEPVTLHKYLYAGADPVMMVDPSGNLATTQGLGAALNIQGMLYAAAIGAIVYNEARIDIKTAVVSPLADIQARECARRQAEDCNVKGVNIIFYGDDVPAVRDHIAHAITQRGIDPLLHRWRGWQRQWYNKTEECKENKGLETNLDCDEFPFRSTVEGGKANYAMGKVSLQLLSFSENRSAGSMLNTRLYYPCGVYKSPVPEKNPESSFVVVPAIGLPTTYGQCGDGSKHFGK